MSLIQVISAELNRVVVELLQQLLFWQERQKAQDPLKATKKKRLVSGLRSAPSLPVLVLAAQSELLIHAMKALMDELECRMFAAPAMMQRLHLS